MLLQARFAKLEDALARGENPGDVPLVTDSLVSATDDFSNPVPPRDTETGSVDFVRHKQNRDDSAYATDFTQHTATPHGITSHNTPYNSDFVRHGSNDTGAYFSDYVAVSSTNYDNDFVKHGQRPSYDSDALEHTAKDVYDSDNVAHGRKRGGYDSDFVSHNRRASYDSDALEHTAKGTRTSDKFSTSGKCVTKLVGCFYSSNFILFHHIV